MITFVIVTRVSKELVCLYRYIYIVSFVYSVRVTHTLIFDPAAFDYVCVLHRRLEPSI